MLHRIIRALETNICMRVLEVLEIIITVSDVVCIQGVKSVQAQVGRLIRGFYCKDVEIMGKVIRLLELLSVKLGLIGLM